MRTQQDRWLTSRGNMGICVIDEKQQHTSSILVKGRNTLSVLALSQASHVCSTFQPEKGFASVCLFLLWFEGSALTTNNPT